MKTVLFTPLAFALLFFSCQKNDKPDNPKPPDSTQKYPVRFDVSGFDRTITEFGRTDSLPAQISNLYYVVYSATGVVHLLEQVAGDENFGTFHDSLPAGKYRIALLATEGPANIRDHGLSELPYFLIYPSGDAFYRGIEINVNGAVNQIVSLNRIVTKLKLVFADRVPYDAKEMKMTVAQYPLPEPPGLTPLMAALYLPSGTLATPHPVDVWNYSDMTWLFHPEDKGMTNWSMETTLLLLEPSTVAVEFTTFTTTGSIIARKEIYNVRMEPGKTTVLTGNGFDNPVNGDGVSLIINDPVWSEDSIAVSF
ncbi:hypothetical protein ACFOTA_12310 [Chitinophaga sp. GCM10012297]|uniref:FimB/Mfa2 family fimbrial subunit n=1 Tax=Chitinophaga chungangae TaxID=2821488 RepID=A0ABS3YEW0_9BACT|nr:hypothetical protein [Chitinophaga chungangae]MBO9152995.1 hypothetical protein [Chitinophaga chungangae]